MKKIYGHIIILAMTALIAAACSHDSDIVPENGGDVPVVPVAQETPIAFSAAQGEEQAVTRAHDTNGMTRAGTPLSESAKSFTVWGYKNDSYTQTGDVISYSDLQTVFPGYTVNWTQNSAGTTTSNSSGWEYILLTKPEQTIKYWDWSAVAYRFFAVTGTSGTHFTSVETTSTYNISILADVTNATARNELPYYSTLWFSTGNPESYRTRQFGQPVQLEFLKACSTVRIMFTYVYPREGIMLSDISFKPTTDYNSQNPVGIARKGTVTVSYPLTGTSTSETCSITPATGENSGRLEAFTEDYDPDNITKQYPITGDGWYYVLPNNTQDSYTLKVNINGVEKSCAVPAAYMQWLPGYSYTYVFKINEEGGVEIDLVESAFTPWIQEFPGNRDVFNW